MSAEPEDLKYASIEALHIPIIFCGSNVDVKIKKIDLKEGYTDLALKCAVALRVYHEYKIFYQGDEMLIGGRGAVLDIDPDFLKVTDTNSKGDLK